MTQSTPPTAPGKPAKPYPGFPLYAHASGRWAKKIRGRTEYFGAWADPQQSLQNFLDWRDDLMAGRRPRAKLPAAVTVADLVNAFLTAKREAVRTGALSMRSWRDYYATCESLCVVVGKTGPADAVGPAEFLQLKIALSRTRGPVSVGNEINRVRVVFNWGCQQKLLATEPHYGAEFKRPSRRILRAERARRGERLITADELRTLIEAARQPMKSMILLGINCGFSNNDVASLEFRHLDLDAGWVDFPRPKTGIDRRCPLWPETVAAIRQAIEERDVPKNPEDERLVFLTRYRNPWIVVSEEDGREGNKTDGVTRVFAEMLTLFGMKRPGLSFGVLRRLLETVGGGCRDQLAVDRIMGHADHSVADRYRERFDDARLRAVVDVVRVWCFGG